MKDTQSRKIAITLNNPLKYGFSDEKIQEAISKLTSSDYSCYSHEISKSGTPHVHIFVHSDAPIRFSTVKRAFPAAHIEKAYGSIRENIDYIKKEGKYADTEKAKTKVEGSFWECGAIPEEGQARQSKMAEIVEMVEDGSTTMDIIKSCPKFAFKVKEIDALRETMRAEKHMTEQRKVEVTYLYGDTGTGKTRSIFAKYEPADVCRITSYSNARALFDSYRGQSVLVFEEFRSQIPLAEMLSYLDVYPLMLPARYADRAACYTNVYIISNIPLSQQYLDAQSLQPATWAAFLRRISHVVHQCAPGVQVEEEKESFDDGK